MLPYLEQLNKREIWELAQNKPSLIAKDFELFDIDKNITYAILLARGVFKWLACRRDIIKLKDAIKIEVKDSLNQIRRVKEELRNDPQNHKHHNDLYYWRGYLKAKGEDRKAIRAICHSERYRAPDFDKDAINFLINKKG